jgi:archaellin
MAIVVRKREVGMNAARILVALVVLAAALALSA